MFSEAALEDAGPAESGDRRPVPLEDEGLFLSAETFRGPLALGQFDGPPETFDRRGDEDACELPSGSAFEIDYTGAIQAHAPETSQAMIMLIGHLLEPAACNRPINAIALLDEIRLVKSGELPQASLEKRGSLFIAVLKKIGSWLKKLQPRPKMVKISKTYWSEWPKVHGVVRSVFRHNDKQYVEYTFDANDSQLAINFIIIFHKISRGDLYEKHIIKN